TPPVGAVLPIGQPEVHGDLGARDVPGIVTGEPRHGGCNVLRIHHRLGERVHEEGTQGLGLLLNQLHQPRDVAHGCVDTCRVHAVDPDVELAQLVGQTPTNADDAV